ncbi:hypothetical protein YC2023_122025 [Brassica napus]
MIRNLREEAVQEAVPAVPSVLSGSIHNSTKRGVTRVKGLNGQRGFTLGDMTVWMDRVTAAYPDSLAQAVKAKGNLVQDAKSFPVCVKNSWRKEEFA